MDWVDRLHGFHFDYDSVFDHQIDSISDLELLAFVDDWQGHLGCHLDATSSQFVPRQA